MSERVAVILVDYNGGAYLPRALACLREQTRPPDRVIVVDNDSTDGSPEWVEANHPEVEVLRMGYNAGFAAGNNAGVQRAADCDWIALLNVDAFPEPGWLAALLRAAHAQPQFGFFTSRLVRAHDGAELDGTGDAYHVSGLVWRRDHGRHVGVSRSGEVFGACAAAALYRRDAWLAVGGFDEHFFCYLEDVDLSFRLRLAGQRCLYVADSVAAHVGSALTGPDSDFTVYHSQRNMIWAWVKDMPWPLAVLYLPQHVLVNAVLAGWMSSRGLGRTVRRAKGDALRELPRVLRQRRGIQARRQVGWRDLRRQMSGGLEIYRATAARRQIDALRERVRHG